MRHTLRALSLLCCLASWASFAPAAWARGKELPKQPLEGQQRPPCAKGLLERNGGCWAEVKQASGGCWFYVDAQEGKCYAPVNTPPSPKP